MKKLLQFVLSLTLCSLCAAQTLTVGGTATLTGTLTCAVPTNPVAATPTASPAPGSYSGTQSVALTSSTAGASIYYTTDGSTPTTSSTLYTGAISVATTTTIKALAAKSGYTQSGVFSGTYTINSGDQVATPTLSSAAGDLAPGTAVTASDSTSGALIFYTWDGTTPTYAVLNGQYVPTGSTMEYRPADYPTGWPIYGPKTFKLLAAASGMTDSNVASYAYTLSSPTGTALSACGTLAASTNYYLTGNVSASGSCFISGGNTWTLNMNGYTATYGTGHTALVAATAGVTNGTTTLTCSSCSFSSGMVGDTLNVDDGGQYYLSTTIASYVSATQVTLAGTPGWSSSGNNVHVWAGSAVYGLLCDGVAASGCLSAKIYNGTLTQSTDINPDSHAVQLGNPGQYPDNETNIVSDITFNINSQDVHAIVINASPSTYGMGDLIQFNTVHDTSTVVYNRDLFVGTPFIVEESSGTNVTSPVDQFKDNVITQSPQGSLQTQVTSNAINNNFDAGTVIMYVGGYGAFLNRPGSLARGNNISGWQRGLELECTSTTTGCTFDQNVVNTTDPADVHDPGHNPNHCEIGGNDTFRVKNYNNPGDGNYVDSVVSNNVMTTTADACPAQGMRFSQMNSGDTGTIENNQITLVMDGNIDPTAVGPSGVYSGDSGGTTTQEYMNGYTFSGNIIQITGPYASTGFDISFDVGGATGWTMAGLASPSIWGGALVPLNSSGTFSGTGTATMSCISGHATISVTYNGVAVPCP